MRRTTTLTALAGLLALPVGLGVSGTPAHAAETCDGKVATIVVTELVNSYTSAPVTGTPGDDVILGTEENDTIDGAGGNDTICGLAGADTLVGGAGDDRLFGGADDEYAADDGYFGDLLVPGAGDDLVDLGTGEPDIWFWESPLEVDQVSYADSHAGVRVDLTAGTATGHGDDTIVGAGGRPTGVIGSPHDDVLLGTDARDIVSAGGGDDTVETGAGADIVLPDDPGRTTSGWRDGVNFADREPLAGDDTVSAGAGSDSVRVARGGDTVRGAGDVDRLFSTSPEGRTRLLGGSGKDRFYVLEGATSAVLLGQSGNDQFTVYLADGSARPTFDGGAGRDRLILYTRGSSKIDLLGVDTARGRVDVDRTLVARLTGMDRISFHGKAARAVFVGGPRADWFESTARSTRASGGGGNDRLTGGRGADVLDGGPGRDVLDGSFGRDRCLRGERLQSCERRR